MSLLSALNDVTARFSLPELSSAVGSSNETARQLLSFVKDICGELRDRCDWPELHKTFSFTLSNGEASYALPEDHDRWVHGTGWNQDETEPVLFPTSAADWNQLKYGISNVSLMDQLRVFGSADKQLFVHPTPDSATDGEVISIEYISRQCFRPRTWAASTVFAAGSYCWNDGNIYTTTAGGTSGSSAPSHTNGTASDGGVSWVYSDEAYLEFTADTDEFLIDEELVIAGLLWLYSESKGLSFSSHQKRYEEKLARAKSKKRGAKAVALDVRAPSADWRVNIPLGNWSE